MSKKLWYIPLNECLHSYLYKICSRNLRFGVFDSTQNCFYGIREKYDYEYIFPEYHYDCGPPYGTVTPKELICKCEINLDNEEELFKWLEQKEKEYTKNNEL